MIISYKTVPGQPITEKEKEEIRKAQKLEAQFDDDCPELSDAMLKALKASVRNRNRILKARKA